MPLSNLLNAEVQTSTHRNYTSQNCSLAKMILCLIVGLCALSAKEASASPQLLSQQNFVYTPSEMLDFDIEAYLQANAPELVEHGEVISHWAGRTSISPKIILTLIEHQSLSLSNSDSSEKLDTALVSLSKEETLSARIKDISTRIADSYYKNLAENTTDPEMKSLTALLKQSTETSADPNLKKNKVIRNFTNSFTDTFFTLFPDSPSIQQAEAEAKTTSMKSVPSQSLFQLPYPIGQAWQTWGGTHTFTGNGSGPFSSLDFRRSRVGFGANTSNIWVSSASSGRAIRHSSCFVEVLASGGWSTTYYHLDNVRINTGQTVAKNTQLANYADNLSQSLCGGGMSNGPHLHFSLKLNGVHVSLDSVTLSGYQVHAGRSNYESNCSRFRLSKNGINFCNGTPIPNNPASSTGPDLSVSSIQTSSQSLNGDEPFSISSRLDNLGTTSARASSLVFLLSADSAITLSDVRIAELPTSELLANESALYSVDSLRLNVAGDFWLGACVVSVVGEINVSNNCSSGLPVTVGGQGSSVLPSVMLLLDED
ncbi:MAG: LasA protease [Arenicella sp.]|jgi:LasA protease